MIPLDWVGHFLLWLIFIPSCLSFPRDANGARRCHDNSCCSPRIRSPSVHPRCMASDDCSDYEAGTDFPDAEVSRPASPMEEHPGSLHLLGRRPALGSAASLLLTTLGSHAARAEFTTDSQWPLWPALPVAPYPTIDEKSFDKPLYRIKCGSLTS